MISAETKFQDTHKRSVSKEKEFVWRLELYKLHTIDVYDCICID